MLFRSRRPGETPLLEILPQYARTDDGGITMTQLSFLDPASTFTPRYREGNVTGTWTESALGKLKEWTNPPPMSFVDPLLENRDRQGKTIVSSPTEGGALGEAAGYLARNVAPRVLVNAFDSFFKDGSVPLPDKTIDTKELAFGVPSKDREGQTRGGEMLPYRTAYPADRLYEVGASLARVEMGSVEDRARKALAANGAAIAS